MLENVKKELVKLKNGMNQNSAAVKQSLPKLELALNELKVTIAKDDKLEKFKNNNDSNSDIASINALLDNLSYKAALKLKFINEFPNYINK